MRPRSLFPLKLKRTQSRTKQTGSTRENTREVHQPEISVLPNNHIGDEPLGQTTLAFWFARILPEIRQIRAKIG